MRISLEGKRVLVGGATAGLGRAIAFQLAACGAAVTIVGRNEEKLQATLHSLAAPADGEHQYLLADYTQLSSYSGIIAAHLASHPVDILINNTQGPAPGTALQKGLPDYQQAFDLLFQTALATTMAALPGMQAQGWGRIINVASSTVREPLSYLVLSNAMRTALTSWAKSLSAEVAKEGITVNTLLTGNFDTERLQSLMKNAADASGKSLETVHEERIALIPAGRLGSPEEFAHAAAFLASDFAAYITGVSLPVDGGLLRGL